MGSKWRKNNSKKIMKEMGGIGMERSEKDIKKGE